MTGGIIALEKKRFAPTIKYNLIVFKDLEISIAHFNSPLQSNERVLNSTNT
jgi:hypothetical protein